MKFPKKLWPLSLGFIAMGFLASASALAATPPAPKPNNNLPNYMVVAADLDNKAYMDCVRANSKPGTDKNPVPAVQGAINCAGKTN